VVAVVKFAAPICKTGLLLQRSHFAVYIQHILTEFSSLSGTVWQEIGGSAALEIFIIVHITLHNTEGRGDHLYREAFHNLF